MAKGLLDMATDYIGNMGDAKEENKEHEEPYEGGCPRGGRGWGFCADRQGWGKRRAVILRKPEEILVGEPGKIVFAEIEV